MPVQELITLLISKVTLTHEIWNSLPFCSSGDKRSLFFFYGEYFVISDGICMEDVIAYEEKKIWLDEPRVPVLFLSSSAENA